MQRLRIVGSSFLLVVILSVTGLTLAGCSDARTTGDVVGTVSVDGELAKTGSIAFFPVDGKSPTAGAPIKDGKYVAEVPLGMARVEIRVSKVVGEKKLYDTPNSPVTPITAESLPPKYNAETELTLDVKPGETQKNYELSTE